MLAHPADHVQDQQAGQQHQRRLEPLTGRAGQPLAGEQHGQRQQAGQQQAEHYPDPEIESGSCGAGLLADPRVQDADHQQGFDTFPPDDEQ
ncbi:hypothetical protein D3C86_2036850 [compost metagenome]